MKSGLEGRNNSLVKVNGSKGPSVSMKSGLEGRNNRGFDFDDVAHEPVSMKSGLEGRNNHHFEICDDPEPVSLNEVRPRRPEQWGSSPLTRGQHIAIPGIPSSQAP